MYFSSANQKYSIPKPKSNKKSFEIASDPLNIPLFHSWGGSRNPHFFPSSLLKNHPSCIVCIHILNVSSKKAQAYYYNCCWLCVYTIAKKSRTIQLKNAIQLSELIEAEQMKTPRTEKTSRGNCITVAKNAKFSMTIFTHWVHKKNGRALLLVVLCYMLPFCVVCLEKNGVWSSPLNQLKKRRKNGWKIQNVSFDLCIFTHH